MSRPSPRDPHQSQMSHQMAAASARPSSRRLPSSSWGRLRAPAIDPLEVYGLPSKGETRLHDFKTQEQYFKKIVERYMRFCASSGSGEALESAFTRLAIISTPPVSPLRPIAPAPPQPAHDAPAPGLPDAARQAQDRELGLLLAAMRKLREAIVAAHRVDDFAQRAYMFVIHACILTAHWESYAAALRYLLQRIHPATPLSQPEAQEFAAYWVLDLACRQNELGEALRARRAWRVRDRRVDMALKALVADDWTLFWHVRRRVDGYQRALMGWAEERVRTHALKCLGRAYFTAEKGFVERSADASWEKLVRLGVGWELGEAGVVTIRRVKPK